MKKFLLLSFLIFSSVTNLNAETNRVVSGNVNAKITIIVYESLTCSHCATFHKEVYPLLKKEFIDTGLLKIEFRHFPLDIAALNAAKIVQCKQDQSLEILHSLYSNQQAWVKGNTVENINENLKEYLSQSGFDVNYEKCLNNKEIEDFVLNDRIQGVKAFKINATPTIIINEKKFEKTPNYKNLKKSLEKLL